MLHFGLVWMASAMAADLSARQASFLDYLLQLVCTFIHDAHDGFPATCAGSTACMPDHRTRYEKQCATYIACMSVIKIAQQAHKPTGNLWLGMLWACCGLACIVYKHDNPAEGRVGNAVVWQGGGLADAEPFLRELVKSVNAPRPPGQLCPGFPAQCMSPAAASCLSKPSHQACSQNSPCVLWCFA